MTKFNIEVIGKTVIGIDAKNLEEAKKEALECDDYFMSWAVYEAYEETRQFTILTNKYFEDEVILLDTNTQENIMQGDYYHDNILVYINGYLKGLESFGIKLNIKKETGQHNDFVVQEEY